MVPRTVSSALAATLVFGPAVAVVCATTCVPAAGAETGHHHGHHAHHAPDTSETSLSAIGHDCDRHGQVSAPARTAERTTAVDPAWSGDTAVVSPTLGVAQGAVGPHLTPSPGPPGAPPGASTLVLRI